MSQKAFLAAFDSMTFTSAIGTGMGDDAQYTAPGGQPTACRVLVDRGVLSWGDDPMPVAGDNVTVGFLRAEVDPVRCAVVVVDGDTYKLTDKLRDDGSLSRWQVARG